MKRRLITLFVLGFVLRLLLYPMLLLGATVVWVGGSGDWNTATNWSTGALPGTNDDVSINPSGGPFIITHSSGSHTVKSLQSQQAFILSGGTMAISNSIQVNNTFTLSGGILIGATVVPGTNGQAVIASGSSTLDGVTVNGNLDVGNQNYGASVTVTNGLVLNGTAWVGNPTNQSYGHIDFAGSQSLGGRSEERRVGKE